MGACGELQSVPPPSTAIEDAWPIRPPLPGPCARPPCSPSNGCSTRRRSGFGTPLPRLVAHRELHRRPLPARDARSCTLR
eukprot:6312741-Pyramimonas_sp.AAC.1